MAKGGGGIDGTQQQQQQGQPMSVDDLRSNLARLQAIQSGNMSQGGTSGGGMGSAMWRVNDQSMRNMQRAIAQRQQQAQAPAQRPTSLGGMPIDWGTGGPPS